jgi:tetratricopeptide (TPR) repeat protein
MNAVARPEPAPPRQRLADGLRAAEACIVGGRIDQARAQARTLEALANQDPLGLQHLAALYVHAADFDGALRCHERAVALAPQQPGLLVNLASSCTTLGQMARAQALLEQAIQLDPADFGAHHQLALLKRWTADDNHIATLARHRAALPADHAGQVPLGYALAKELEDLGDEAASFQALQRAAQARRRRLAYRVDADVAAMDQLRAVFDEGNLVQRAEPLPHGAGPRPWFVLGLPRSGTTLVERMLGSHSALASLGEVEAFAFALLGLAGQAGAAGGKQALIERSARLDMAQLGGAYRSAIASYGVSAGGLINKTPLNFLYLGLIHRSLPEARVVHLRRHPLDSCYAMYKTLFRMGYPFSYSLADLGAYYLAYHRLMAHWRALIPASFIDIDYEALVAEPAAQAGRLLAHGGLPWEDACLAFQHNPAPSATASASQVREPLHRRSAGRWRAHARELAPLADFLQANGIDCS